MDTAWPIVHPKTPADALPAPPVQAQRPPPPAAHDNKVFVNKKFIQPTNSAARSIPPTNTVYLVNFFLRSLSLLDKSLF